MTGFLLSLSLLAQLPVQSDTPTPPGFQRVYISPGLYVWGPRGNIIFDAPMAYRLEPVDGPYVWRPQPGSALWNYPPWSLRRRE